jgi:hypothetical protein
MQNVSSEPLSSKKFAEDTKKAWRRLLGGDKTWTVNRRPGIDTLDHLVLKIEQLN